MNELNKCITKGPVMDVSNDLTARKAINFITGPIGSRGKVLPYLIALATISNGVRIMCIATTYSFYTSR